jgi:hypothetical protein
VRRAFEMVRRSIFCHADFLDPCDGLHGEALRCRPPQDEQIFLASSLTSC